MRALLLVIGITSACSGNAGTRGGNDGEAGAGGESARVEPGHCERADHLGRFTVRYELLSGTCGEPADETATVTDLDAVEPCERLAEDEWSADNCTRRQHVSCSSTELATELTLQPDGSLTGEQTRTLSGCSSRYRVTWTRQ